MHCSFCASSGIVGPHDHFLRTTRAYNAPICCPKLLSTKCSGCGRFGHTPKYCGELQDKLRLARKADAESKKKAISNGNWIEATKVVRTKAVAAKVVSNNKNRVGFATLSVDDSDSEGEEVCVPSVPTRTWVDITREGMFIEKRPEGMSWADWDEE